MAITRNSWREPKPDPGPCVIIVGAGFAGLSAAQQLHQAGIPFVIVEGRDRVGGRAWTLNLREEQDGKDDNSEGDGKDIFVDMGGAWVDGGPNYNSVYTLAEQEAGLTLKPNPYIDNTLEIGRVHRIYDATKKKWVGWFRLNYHIARAAVLALQLAKPGAEIHTKATNLRERLDELYASNPWGLTPWDNDKFIIETHFKMSNGYPLEQLHPEAESTGYFQLEDEYEKGSEYMIEGGYQKLIEHVQKDLPDDCIRLEQRVTAVIDGEEGIQVQTATGSVYTGSHVLVTVPLGVLKEDKIAFSPPLPMPKLQAIGRIGFGTLEKVVMTFPTTFWRADPKRRQTVTYCSYDDRFPIYVDVTDTTTSFTPTLVVVAATPEAQRQVREEIENVKKLLLERLEEMFPKTYEQPLITRSTSWKEDPFAYGAYSCLATTTKPGDFDLLAEPHGRIRFAGEATSNKGCGYVEGAILSGQREATRIVEELGKKQSS